MANAELKISGCCSRCLSCDKVWTHPLFEAFWERGVKCSCCPWMKEPRLSGFQAYLGCLSHLHRYEETWLYRGGFFVCRLINFIVAMLSYDLLSCCDSSTFKLCLFVPPVKPTKQSTITEGSWSALLKNLLLVRLYFISHSWPVMEFWFVGGDYKNLAEEKTVTIPTLDAVSWLCLSLKCSKPVTFHKTTVREC